MQSGARRGTVLPAAFHVISVWIVAALVHVKTAVTNASNFFCRLLAVALSDLRECSDAVRSVAEIDVNLRGIRLRATTNNVRLWKFLASLFDNLLGDASTINVEDEDVAFSNLAPACIADDLAVF